jgi:hypothetical protein
VVDSIPEDVSTPATRTCLTSPDSPAPSDNPLASEQTLVQQTVDDDLLCATYFARCVSGGSCTDAEVEAGKWKWVYGSLTDFECKELQAGDMTGDFKYVTCCSVSNCNMPDAELDPASHLAAGVSKLERADAEQQQPAGNATAAATDSSTAAATSTAAPATSTNSSSSSIAAGSTTDASIPGSTPVSNSTARTAVSSADDPKSVYFIPTRVDKRNQTALSQKAPADGKYGAEVDPATKTKKHSATSRSSTPNSGSSSSSSKATPQPPKGTPNSNSKAPAKQPAPRTAPHKAADRASNHADRDSRQPGAFNKPPPAGQRSSSSSSRNADQDTPRGQTVRSQQQQQRPGSGRDADDKKQQKPKQQQPTPEQKRRQQQQKQRQQQIQQQRQRQAEQIQRQRQQQQLQKQRQRQQQQRQQQQQQRFKPKHVAQGPKVSTLTCLRTVPRTRDLPPAVAPKAYRKVDGVDMCARYKFKCAQGDKTCTAAEIKSKAWKWAYMPLSSSTCLELKGYADKNDAVIKNVLCCSSTNCNRPSPALDPRTKVSLWTVVTAGFRCTMCILVFYDS